jgi:ParB-like chromosome segregation protein Spo0J
MGMKIVNKPIEELLPAEYNPRTLTKKQEEDIRKSLETFGFVDPVIINIHPERKNVIIGGHQRTKVWAKMGNKTVPCIECNLNPALEKELCVRLNLNVAQWDFELLEEEFNKEDLISWGFDIDDFPPDEETTDVRSHERSLAKQFVLKVICRDENDYNELKTRMESQGRECK